MVVPAPNFELGELDFEFFNGPDGWEYGAGQFGNVDANGENLRSWDNVKVSGVCGQVLGGTSLVADYIVSPLTNCKLYILYNKIHTFIE